MTAEPTSIPAATAQAGSSTAGHRDHAVRPRTTSSATSTADGSPPPRSPRDHGSSAPSSSSATKRGRRSRHHRGRGEGPARTDRPSPASSATLRELHGRGGDRGTASSRSGPTSRPSTPRKIEDLVGLTGRLQRKGVSGFFGVGAERPQQSDRTSSPSCRAASACPTSRTIARRSSPSSTTNTGAHLGRMLTLAEVPDAEQAAAAVVELETALAAHHWDRVKTRDAQARYNLLTGDQLRPCTLRSGVAGRVRHRCQGLRRGRRLAALLSGRHRKGPGGAAARGLAGTGSRSSWSAATPRTFPTRSCGRTSPSLRQARRHHGTEGAVEARRRVRGGRGRRGHRPALRRAPLPARDKEIMEGLVGNLTEAYRQSIAALPWMGRETIGRGPGEALQVPRQDRLPGQVERLLRRSTIDPAT